jgi:hypothetical protein
MDLSPQSMEIVRCSRAIDNLHVVKLELFLQRHLLLDITIVITKLKESFDAALTVFGTLAIHAVRKG